MNKLSSCELFAFVDKSFVKMSIRETIEHINKNIDKYSVELPMYDHIVKMMRSYKYPLTKLVVNSALSREIIPLLLADPKNKKDDQIILPAAICTISAGDGSRGYVDITPRAKYNRDKFDNVDSLKIKEVELYNYLQMSFIDTYTKRYMDVIDKSREIIKNVAIAYSRLLTRCISRKYPIIAEENRGVVSIYLTALFCIKTFFNMSTEDASNLIFSSGICNKATVYNDCKAMRDNKLEFTNLSSFLEVYTYEFDDYIKEGQLTLRSITSMYTGMYGANTFFALEHCTSFINIILGIPIGLYNDRFITETIKAQVEKINNTLLQLFSIPR